MPHGDVALERAQDGFIKNIGDEAHVLEYDDSLAVADANAGGFLATVLEGKEAEVRESGDVLPRGPNAEDAAFLARFSLPLIVKIGQWGGVGSDSSMRRVNHAPHPSRYRHRKLKDYGEPFRDFPRARPRGVDATRLHRRGPLRHSQRQFQPGARVRLDHIRGRAAGVTRPLNALDGHERGNTQLHAVSRRVVFDGTGSAPDGIGKLRAGGSRQRRVAHPGFHSGDGGAGGGGVMHLLHTPGL